jgi:hypothetical protein
MTGLGLAFLALFASAASSQGVDEYSAAVSPTTITVGAGGTFTVTLTNSGSSGSMGSANVTVNGGFTSISAGTPTTPGWSANLAGNVVQLRSAAGSEIGPGSNVSVAITATAPTTTGSHTWTTDAKPTNDFSGTAELTLSGSDPAVTVTPGPLDHFTFASIVDQVAGTAFNVTATAYDAFDNVKTDYTGGATLSGNLGEAPDGTDPTYGSFGTWIAGVASASVTAFKAETGRNVTATDTDSGKTGTSNNFTVAPGPLDHFTIANIADQVAGTAFNATATAYDEWDNIKTNYAGGATLSGNLNLAPDTTAPIYGSFGTWTAGVASASVTAFKAESGRNVTATDGGATGTSNNFTVAPGPLDHFTIANIVDQVAGTAFNVTATAFDEWDNVKTNYGGGATLSGNLSNSFRGCGAGNASPCSALYGSFGTWTSGVASASVTAFKAETGRNVTATDSGKTGTSNNFSVGPNVHATPPTRFSQQPTLTQVNIVITPAVEVTVEDFWGNPRQGDTVSLAIGTNPSGGTLSGMIPQTTNSSGIATFANLSIGPAAAVGVGYTLVATVNPPAPTISVISDAFDIANQVTPCSGSCTATGTTGSVTSTVTASRLGGGAFASRLGPAASSALGPSRLGVTIAGSIDIPAGVCGTGSTPFTQYGEGFASTSVKSPGNQPSFKIVAVLDKEVVRTKPGNPGATKWDICLGAINVLNPPVGLPNGYQPPPSDCDQPSVDVSWRTKDGSCAIFSDGYFWGLLATYQSKVKACPTNPGSGLFPGALSKMKDNAGDLVITSCAPYSYDEKGGFG